VFSRFALRAKMLPPRASITTLADPWHMDGKAALESESAAC